jgi:hypothetical protein
LLRILTRILLRSRTTVATTKVTRTTAGIRSPARTESGGRRAEGATMAKKPWAAAIATAGRGHRVRAG